MIDWSNLQPLPVRNRRDPFERDRLGKKAKRKHPKRHGENRERSIQAKAKVQRLAYADDVTRLNHSAYLAAARAYWRGELENHPQHL